MYAHDVNINTTRLMCGKCHAALQGFFRRAQLKALVGLHATDEGLGGNLTPDEISIITGALDLTSKTAWAAMTPINKVRQLTTSVLCAVVGQILCLAAPCQVCVKMKEVQHFAISYFCHLVMLFALHAAFSVAALLAVLMPAVHRNAGDYGAF
eukprot:GHRR01037447.1.p1 GENE.GHRR01037447.1~~GHRR01037447.1.p1  ORF type:complete len:153 (+),score=37.45 GHRR01037447.1:74-532(+)